MREVGTRGQWQQWARRGKAAPGGGAGRGGRSGSAAAHQPQHGAHGDRLGFGVPAAAAFCAACCEEGAGDGLGVEGGGGGGICQLREVGGGDERGTAVLDPPVPGPGPQGGGATGQGARDGTGQVEEDAGGGPPRAGPDRSKGNGDEAQGANAEGAAAKGGVVLKEAGDNQPARRGAEGMGSVQGNKKMSTDHQW